MADSSRTYHLRKTCTNYDVTSNLKQRRHTEVVKIQSKGLMSSRSSHSSNFSAWIERFKSLDFVKDAHDRHPGEAQVAAVEMQAKLAQIEKDRNERLQKFQQDVCERVKQIKKQQLNEEFTKSIEKLEKENTVVCQSAFPKKVPSAKNDACSFRSCLSIDKIKNIMTGEANVDPSHNIENVLKSVDGINQNAEKIKSQSNQARARLVSKIIQADVMELPGGVWGNPNSKVNDLQIGQSDTDQHKIADKELRVPFDELSKQFQEKDTKQRGIILNDMWKNFNADEKKVTSMNDEAPSVDSTKNEKQRNESRMKERKKIRFHFPDSDQNDLRKVDQVEVDTIKSRIDFDTKCDQFVKRDVNEETAKKNQYWTYRKLFMDIEREKVRERQRRKRHQQVISKLKRDKEIERSIIEKEVEVVLPKQSYGGHDDHADQLKQNYQKDAKTESKVIARRKEFLRYIEALKNLIYQKTLANEKPLPSICSCGGSLLETNPETCANNCIFYNNPQGMN